MPLHSSEPIGDDMKKAHRKGTQKKKRRVRALRREQIAEAVKPKR